MPTDDPRFPPTCSRCGAALPTGTGECPRCLLGLGVPDDPPPVWIETSGAATAGRAFGPPPTLEEVRAALPQLEVEELVGQGGMGSVFRARQRELGRVVALKVLPRSLGEDPTFAERFAREARALARLTHPGIVVVHDFGKTGGLPWLVMEFVDGVNLRALLHEGPLEPAQALSIARELCDALQYAHDEGVVHRDIKPENVLVDARGRVKVADFGLAKLLGAPGDASLTRSDVVMGTPHYMAPEQMERPLEVDHRADLFALGVVLYEMLTGSLPRGTFEPPSHRVRVDVRLDRIVLKALEREPVRRYQQALEIKTDVDGIPSADAADAPDARAPAGGPAHAAGDVVRTRSRAAPDGRMTARQGWRALLLFALAWVLVAVSFNLGPFAFGAGCLLPLALQAWLLRERVHAVPGWAEALARLPRGQRAARRFAFGVGGLLCLGLVAFGHLARWESGVHGWQPTSAGTSAAIERMNADPWGLLRLAAPDEVDRWVREDAQPRVVLDSNRSSVPPGLSRTKALLAIVLGFALWAAILAATVHVREPHALRRRAWHVGAELASFALCGLLVLWVGGPLIALRSHQVMQGVAASTRTELAFDDALARLRPGLEARDLEVDVEQHLRIVDRRDGREYARVALLRAASADPFERWSAGARGPVRETPQVWATLIERPDGEGTVVQLDAGLFDPREPQHERALAALRELELSLQR